MNKTRHAVHFQPKREIVSLIILSEKKNSSKTTRLGERKQFFCVRVLRMSRRIHSARINEYEKESTDIFSCGYITSGLEPFYYEIFTINAVMEENYLAKSFASGRRRSTNQMHAIDGEKQFIDLMFVLENLYVLILACSFILSTFIIILIAGSR